MKCQLQNATVHYTVHGTGLPFLMIHGNTMDHRMMKACMEPLFANRKGYQRIYLDLPGMGQTPAEEWIQGTDEMLTVVLEFIERVIPDQRFLIAGESYGGYISRGVLLHHHNRIDGMALICPMIIADRSKRVLPERTVISQDETFLATLSAEERDRLAPLAVVHDQYVWERCQAEVFSGTSIADREFLAKVWERFGYSFDVDSQMPRYDKPTLFLLGRQDSVTGYADALQLMTNYPRGSFAVLDRAGHMLQIEQPDLFNALISEWLDRVEEAQPLFMR